jgi:hypothetical protein
MTKPDPFFLLFLIYCVAGPLALLGLLVAHWLGIPGYGN